MVRCTRRLHIPVLWEQLTCSFSIIRSNTDSVLWGEGWKGWWVACGQPLSNQLPSSNKNGNLSGAAKAAEGFCVPIQLKLNCLRAQKQGRAEKREGGVMGSETLAFPGGLDSVRQLFVWVCPKIKQIGVCRHERGILVRLRCGKVMSLD